MLHVESIPNIHQYGLERYHRYVLVVINLTPINSKHHLFKYAHAVGFAQFMVNNQHQQLNQHHDIQIPTRG